jgi:hypothetical protein
MVDPSLLLLRVKSQETGFGDESRLKTGDREGKMYAVIDMI